MDCPPQDPSSSFWRATAKKSCILNGLKCGDLCRLTECTNQPDENVDLYVEEDEDDDHDLSLGLDL